jgi:hypothetical protein
MVYTSASNSMNMVGCTNYIQITITVPGAGNIALISTMHWWIDHTNGAIDGWAFTHRTAPDDCSAAIGAPQMYADEISPTLPTDNVNNRVGTVLNVYNVAGAGTYTYFLNSYMWQGESADDRIRDATTMAIFFPS